MAAFPTAIILPPKLYYYEPKIFGFNMFGKRGSKFYSPVKGGIRYTEEEEDVDQLIANFKQKFKL